MADSADRDGGPAAGPASGGGASPLGPARLLHWLRARLVVILGLAACALAVAALIRVRREDKPLEVTIATGGIRGLRYQFLMAVADESAPHRVRIRPEVIVGMHRTIEQLEGRRVDFAMLQGSFDFSRHADLRLAAVLDVEPLHLLVKEELYPDVARSLRALKGKLVGPGGAMDGVGRRLALEVLSFAGLEPPTKSSPGDFRMAGPEVDIAAESDRDRLPDAIFLVSAPPSSTARMLIHRHRYRLVPLPFARAFALNGIAEVREQDAREADYPFLREQMRETLIPAFTYRIDPAEPPIDLPTIETRVLLLTHRDVKPAAVERVLEAMYTNRFARAFQPPLVPANLPGASQKMPWHAGTLHFLGRDRPLLTGQQLSTVANSFTIAAPSIGALLCLWQWIRQRTRARSQYRFEKYILEITRIEAEALQFEIGRPPDEHALMRLHREVGHIKTEALRLFCRGELTGSDLMASFLLQINDTRSYLVNLIRHLREEAKDAPDAAPRSPDAHDAAHRV